MINKMLLQIYDTTSFTFWNASLSDIWQVCKSYVSGIRNRKGERILGHDKVNGSRIKPLCIKAEGNIPADIYFGVVNEIRAPWSLVGVCNNYSTGDVPCFIVESQSKQTWVRRTPPFQLNLSLQIHGVPVFVQCPIFKYSLAWSLGLKLLCLFYL